MSGVVAARHTGLAGVVAATTSLLGAGLLLGGGAALWWADIPSLLPPTDRADQVMFAIILIILFYLL